MSKNTPARLALVLLMCMAPFLVSCVPRARLGGRHVHGVQDLQVMRGRNLLWLPNLDYR